MKLAVLSNSRLNPWINWETLGPPLLEPLASYPGHRLLAPVPLSELVRSREVGRLLRDAWQADTVFWMQGSSRPEPPLTIASLMAGRARRSAFVVDPWRTILEKLALAARVQSLDPLFVSFREAASELKQRGGKDRFDWLPFGIDTRFFRPRHLEKDVFAFWMGRRYEPLHRALLAYCQKHGLTYIYRQEGVSGLLTSEDLGVMASRSEYFIVTPPDLDNAARTGGYSPLVMRYMEGLAAGARLLGVLPRSGEYQDLLPGDAILTVAPDGSDLAARLDEDRRDPVRWDAVARASDLVMREHSWQRRAEQIRDRLVNGTVAFPL